MAKRRKLVLKRGTHKLKKFKPNKSNRSHLFVFVLAFAVMGGIVTLFIANAAVPMTVDSSVPQPPNVRVYPDNQSIYVRWDAISTDSNPYGYYITHKRRGAPASSAIVRQTIWNSIQLQPLENGVEYEITVQTARGSWLPTGIGPLRGATPATTQYWFRANGRVSQPVTTTATTTSARVDAMRNRLTGFFDDFNEPANPINELKWNSATTGRSGTNSNGTFINAQFHAHTQLNSGFGGLVNRPRATFNTSTGLNGGPLSESNPARIEWDMDMPYDGRSNWYLDLIPLSVRRDKQILDINAHDQNDVERGDEPANMLRLNINPYIAEFEWWDNNLQLHKLNMRQGNVVCGGAATLAEFYWGGCDFSRKTPGLSPIPQMAEPVWAGPQNVRRHFILELTPSKARVFVDSSLIMESNLPVDFAREVTEVGRRQFTLHNAMFTYNTGKGWDPKTQTGVDARLHTLFPTTHFYHWDNFGFTGPAPTTVIHNYIDGGSDGRTPNYFKGEADHLRGRRSTIIPIPDPIGSPVGGKAKLYFQEWGSTGPYRWQSGDHILVNGRRYDIPNPLSNFINYPGDYANSLGGGGRVHTLMVEVNASDLITGNNTIVSNIQGSAAPATFAEPHLELEYPRSSAPSYTQPIDIFGQSFSNIVEPRMSTCDQWIYTEQDLDLPYQAGKVNMDIGNGECRLLTGSPHHAGHDGPVEPAPDPDVTRPTVTLTAPTNNHTMTGSSIVASANASDNVAVNRVEFYVSGVLRGTDTTSPYSATLDFTSLTPGTYTVHAVAYDSSNNTAQTAAVNVVKPQPPDTTAPTLTLNSPVNGFAVPTNTANLTLSANATDSVGVTRVEFYLDNALVNSRTSPNTGSTYNYTFNPASLQEGTHTWRVRALDAAGNATTSSNRTFTVPETPTPDPDPDPEDPEEPLPEPAKAGDVNGDGRVDIIDLDIISRNWNRTDATRAQGDLDNNRVINIFDLDILSRNWGR